MANKIEKMTNVKALQYVIDNCELPAEIAEKIGNIHASYVKKSSSTGERKPTATQVANEVLKTAILEEMEIGKQYRVSDMVKSFACLKEANASAPKATAMLTQLLAENKVTRNEVKGKSYYEKVDMGE